MEKKQLNKESFRTKERPIVWKFIYSEENTKKNKNDRGLPKVAKSFIFHLFGNTF